MSRTLPWAGLLRAALLFNATFSTACAIGALAVADMPGLPLGEWSPVAMRGLAAGLFGFVLFLLWQVSRLGRPSPPLFAVGLTILMDELWVVGSLVLLAFVHDRWDPLFVTTVAVVAGVVGLAATAQWIGLSRMIRERDPALDTRTRYELSVAVDASADDFWRVLAELEQIHAHSSDLQRSDVAGEGVGAVRTCSNAAGQQWSEEVTAWDPAARAFRVRFRSEAHGFPFPMDPMIGGWRVTPLAADRAEVTLWWSFTTKPAWAAPLLVPLLDRGFKAGMVTTIRSMAAEARAPLRSGAPVAAPAE